MTRSQRTGRLLDILIIYSLLAKILSLAIPDGNWATVAAAGVIAVMRAIGIVLDHLTEDHHGAARESVR